MQQQDLRTDSKITRKELVVLIIFATVTITFVSTSSPLYPFNPWDDANCFFTLGRGIIHGRVPYRDLYEQKGPLLYFLYAFAAVISEKSFTGAWIIECVAASVYSVYSWKIIKLLTGASGHLITVVPLLTGIIYTSKLFNFGGNAEELCFPLITIALYFGLKAVIEGDCIPSGKEALFTGIITGALFWIKYTFTGFTLGFIVFILIVAVRNKAFKKLWSLVWRFLLGFAAVSAPILLYFLVNRALGALWEAYFYNNIFLYYNGIKTYGIASIPLIRNLYFPARGFFNIAMIYKAYGVMLLLTLSSLFFINKKYRLKVILFSVITFVPLACLTFSRAAFIYYYGYIFAYGFCMGTIPLVKLIIWIENKAKTKKDLITKFIAATLVILSMLSVALSKNTYLMFKPKSFLNQFRIAETINQTPEAKILTYKVMDSGFFTAAGLLPVNRFYCFLNLESFYPAISEEQHRLIEEGYFDYIVTSYFCEEEWDNYELVQVETYLFVDFTGEPILDGHKLYKRV